MKLQFRLDLLREDPRSILKLYILGHDLIWSQFEPTINQFHPKLKQSKLNVPPTSKEVLDRLQLKSSPILFGPLTFLVPKKFGRKKFGPMKFGPNESWSPRNLVPTLKSLYGIFMQGPTFLGTKFLQAQSFQGPKMSGTISVTALWPKSAGTLMYCSQFANYALCGTIGQPQIRKHLFRKMKQNQPTCQSGLDFCLAHLVL